jgi:hypothetical protein
LKWKKYAIAALMAVTTPTTQRTVRFDTSV